ncbi:MAG TPA: methyltransferase domain-containing protein [Isosphaeraceae bacterium]
MAAGLAYRSVIGYDLLMRALYGRHYHARSRAVADLIPAGASVLDLCCGTGTLYRRYLRARGVAYTGVDINSRFVDRVRRLGGEALVRDLRLDGELPRADFVVMQAALYHFLPDPGPVLGRMERAARIRVIVAEPIRNLAASGSPIVAAMARRLTDPGTGAQPLRCDEAMLDRLLGGAGHPSARTYYIPGGREKVYVLDVAPGREESPR